jgi:lipopolysaccharide transport system ATP-binding protein
MSNIAIKVENISKCYRIGLNEELYDTLGGALVGWLKSPISNFKRVQKLSKFTNDNSDDIFWAVDDISFEVKQGEVLGIIGRNGAGKSTLLKILARITEPTSGRAEINGRVASLLEVGTGFHQELTGRENVYLNGTILGMTKTEISKKFDEIVDFSGIEKFIDTPVKRYSSGMRVRLAFAVAAHLEPEILLIDEVLAVGDTGFQKKCIGKMSDIAGEGRTVLFVSHNMAAVQSLCSRGILLKDGSVLLNSEINEVVNKYILDVTERIESIDLAKRKDRKSGEKLFFKSIEFYDTDSNKLINSALSGQSISIKINYENLTNNLVKDVNFGLAFYTITGSFLFACGSRPSGKTFKIQPGEGSVWCNIPKLPLNTGRIHFTAHCDSLQEILDNVSDAGYLDVEKGDYYGTGLLPASHLQGVFIDYQYSENGC